MGEMSVNAAILRLEQFLQNTEIPNNPYAVATKVVLDELKALQECSSCKCDHTGMKEKKMNPTDAINALECEIDRYSYDVILGFSNQKAQAAILALIGNARSTRWRKLEEEKPEKEGWYEVWNEMWSQNHHKCQIVWWGRQGREDTCSFPQKLMLHWRPILGPEEDQ